MNVNWFFPLKDAGSDRNLAFAQDKEKTMFNRWICPALLILIIPISSCSHTRSASTSLGPIVGDTTDTGAKIWYKANNNDNSEVVIYEKSSDSPGCVDYLRKEQLTLLGSPGSSSLAKLNDLKPSSTYYFKIVNGIGYEQRICNLDQLYSFRTFPAQQENVDFSFGITSCFSPNPRSFWQNQKKPDIMWGKLYDSLVSKDAAFLLAIGDQVYADSDKNKLKKVLNGTTDEQIDYYKGQYQEHWKYSNLKKTMAHFPTYMIWDDHEITNGWGSEEEHKYTNYQALFKSANQVYREYQNSHNPDPGKTDELFYSFYYGNAAFLVLDLKSHKKIWNKVTSFPDKDNYLGNDQIAYIKSFIADAATKSDILFVVTSVPIAYVSDEINDGLILYNQWIEHLKSKNPGLKESDIPEIQKLQELENLIDDKEVPALIRMLRQSSGVSAMMTEIKKGDETGTIKALREIDILIQETDIPALKNKLMNEGEVPEAIMDETGPQGEALIQMTAMESDSYIAKKVLLSLLCKLRHLNKIVRDHFSDFRDQWSYEGNTRVRNWLLQELYYNYMVDAKKKVFIVGGDSHVSVSSEIRSDSGKTIEQFMSSPIYRHNDSIYDKLLLNYNKCFYNNDDGNFDFKLNNKEKIQVINEDKDKRIRANNYGIVNVQWVNGEANVTYEKNQ